MLLLHYFWIFSAYQCDWQFDIEFARKTFFNYCYLFSFYSSSSVLCCFSLTSWDCCAVGIICIVFPSSNGVICYFMLVQCIYIWLKFSQLIPLFHLLLYEIQGIYMNMLLFWVSRLRIRIPLRGISFSWNLTTLMHGNYFILVSVVHYCISFFLI